MVLDYITLTGLAAGTLTTAAFIPQVIRTWRTRSTRDISLGMFVAFCAGIALWTVYGFLIDSIPVIATNSITFILASIILALKLRHK
ncbi:MAG: SemiSWEET transporter [Thermodesulfovibrionales bacterium]